jgi:hypothetical protein
MIFSEYQFIFGDTALRGVPGMGDYMALSRNSPFQRMQSIRTTDNYSQTVYINTYKLLLSAAPGFRRRSNTSGFRIELIFLKTGPETDPPEKIFLITGQILN